MLGSKRTILNTRKILCSLNQIWRKNQNYNLLILILGMFKAILSWICKQNIYLFRWSDSWPKTSSPDYIKLQGKIQIIPTPKLTWEKNHETYPWFSAVGQHQILFRFISFVGSSLFQGKMAMSIKGCVCSNQFNSHLLRPTPLAKLLKLQICSSVT